MDVFFQEIQKPDYSRSRRKKQKIKSLSHIYFAGQDSIINIFLPGHFGSKLVYISSVINGIKGCRSCRQVAYISSRSHLAEASKLFFFSSIILSANACQT